ncbi:MAG: amino acid adenylation domain-containing protein [Oscillospiraceae bacterium]|nr:amino acid adenylation domain-containing protein [Oscillospiraceae bacterium]
MESYPLTTPQQNIWNLHKYYPDSSIANISGMMRFSAEYSYDAMNKAVNLLIENNDALRLRFFEENGEPRQAVMPYQPIQIAEYDMRGKSLNEVDAFFTNLGQEPISIEDTFLCRFAAVNLDDGLCGFLPCIHHIICDAWSISLIGKEILRYYMQELSDGATPNPMPSFIEAIATEQKYFQSERYEKDNTYWDEVFANKPPICRIKDQRQTLDSATNRFTCELDIDLCNDINEFCNKENISPAILFEAVMITYLHRINDYATPVTINIPVLNRGNASEKKTIGMFISTTLLPVPIEETMSMTELCRTVKRTHMEVFRHQKYPISQLLKNLRSKGSDSTGIRDVAISYQNARIDGHDMEVSVVYYTNGHSDVPLCMHIEDLGNSGCYKLHFEHQTAIISDNEAAKLYKRLICMLRQTVTDNEINVNNIQIVSPDEYKKLIHEYNATEIDYPKDKCIHQLFEEQVKKTPDDVAVVFENKKYSYQQISEMSNSLAHVLREKGVGRNDIVAIIAKRSYKIIVAQLAILKTGGAFMPLDPNYPRERIDFMIDDAKCKTALTLGTDIEGIDMKEDTVFHGNISPIENINSSEDLCYIIYTSGSTGMPKGTIINHRNFINFCDNNNNIQVTIAENCKAFFCLGAFVFDMASAEVFLALLNNHMLILPNDNQVDNPEKLAEFIEKYNVDFILTTPTRMLSYICSSSFASAIQKLKVLSLGGEVLTYEMVAAFKEYTNAIILNGYGPAETTQGCTWTKIDGDISIGTPIANTQVYILDKNLNPLPISVTGELCISGDGVGLGYLNRPELTAEKFMCNPFISGKRMYKTGDLARWREDGNIEFLGRLDYQVKVRGLRIELGEIEGAITTFAGINQIVVVVKNDDNGRQYICAYYISDNELDDKELRADLAKTLPRYMMPHFFIRMFSFPTTTSGKIDRKSFPTPDFTQSQSGVEYIAPVSEQEKLLVQILESVLEISPIGMNDDFFDIGGDSLKAIEFISKAQDEGVKIDLQNVFEYSTPAMLLKHISSDNKKTIKYLTKNFDTIHGLLKQSKVCAGMPASKNSLGNTLITGTTGWLGVHVLDEFLSSESGIAYCLVRGNSVIDSQNRLNSTLEHYFGDKYKDNKQIVVICDDISKKVTFEKPIDTIIHCAANVKHYGVYSDFYDVNVIGTKNIIGLASEKDALLIHISTASVSGNSFDNLDFPATIFDETCLYIEQSLENVYMRSKFEAEVAVLEARLNGLDTIIIRVGNLTNRQSDMVFQKNYYENATLTRLKALADLGMYPRKLASFPIELSPVDETANAIIKIAQHYDRVRIIYHLYNDNYVKLSVFAKTLNRAGIKVKMVSMKRFLYELSKVAKNPNKSYIHKAFVNDFDKNGNLRVENNITLKNSHTNEYLDYIDFNWTKIDSEYMKKYVEYFCDVGYFGGADKNVK